MKNDLNFLIDLNSNIVNVSSEMMIEQTRSKVANFFQSVSQSLKTFEEPTKIDTKNNKEEQKESINAAKSILNITESISETLAKTVKVGSSVDIKLPNISMTVMKKKAGISDSSIWEADSLKVLIQN